MHITLFGLSPNKSETIRQKNLKKIKFYHVGLLIILLYSHNAVKLTISKIHFKQIFQWKTPQRVIKQGFVTRWPALAPYTNMLSFM
jgi:hypothetical protein